VSLLVVRHADAGSPSLGSDDRRRTLTDLGAAQARGLAEQHRERPVRHIASSPYLRCLQTVAPLADALGLEVAIEPGLGETVGAGLAEVLTRYDGDGDGDGDVVLCTHGPVIAAVLDLVRQAGTELGPVSWRTASTWCIDGWPHTPTARLLPAPNVG
jgi:8-oxo-(d)GTP phosphatase